MKQGLYAVSRGVIDALCADFPDEQVSGEETSHP